MGAKTKQDLATDVLRVGLGVIDALHSPSAEDSALIEGQYDHKLAELRDDGLVYWPNTGRDVSEIPEAIFGALVDIMTEDVANAFGKETPSAFDDYGRQVSCGTRGLRKLRAHISKRRSGEPTKAVYY